MSGHSLEEKNIIVRLLDINGETIEGQFIPDDHIENNELKKSVQNSKEEKQ